MQSYPGSPIVGASLLRERPNLLGLTCQLVTQQRKMHSFANFDSETIMATSKTRLMASRFLLADRAQNDENKSNPKAKRLSSRIRQADR